MSKFIKSYFILAVGIENKIVAFPQGKTKLLLPRFSGNIIEICVPIAIFGVFVGIQSRIWEICAEPIINNNEGNNKKNKPQGKAQANRSSFRAEFLLPIYHHLPKSSIKKQTGGKPVCVGWINIIK